MADERINLDANASGLVNALTQAGRAFTRLEAQTASIRSSVEKLNDEYNLSRQATQNYERATDALIDSLANQHDIVRDQLEIYGRLDKRFTTLTTNVNAQIRAQQAYEASLQATRITTNQIATITERLSRSAIEAAVSTDVEVVALKQLARATELELVSARAAVVLQEETIAGARNIGTANAARVKQLRLLQAAEEAELKVKRANIALLETTIIKEEALAAAQQRTITGGRGFTRSPERATQLAEQQRINTAEDASARIIGQFAQQGNEVSELRNKIKALRAEAQENQKAQEQAAKKTRSAFQAAIQEASEGTKAQQAYTQAVEAANAALKEQFRLIRGETSQRGFTKTPQFPQQRGSTTTSPNVVSPEKAGRFAQQAVILGAAAEGTELSQNKLLGLRIAGLRELGILEQQRLKTQREQFIEDEKLFKIEQQRVAEARLQARLILEEEASLSRQIALRSRLRDIRAESPSGRGANSNFGLPTPERLNLLGKAFDGLKASASRIFNLTAISLYISTVFRLQQALIDSTKAAADLSIKIAEIDTIQTTSALGTTVWAQNLRDLSAGFGIPALNQAEAAYQTLSNQVAQGAEAVRFLDAANRLAITGVTDVTSSVNLLTSVINSFKLPVQDAEIISAKLFKTVELGRLRIEELGQSFGKLSVPANQLGISLDEVLGGLAQITIQGIKFDEASTFLRNVILKLIRPTDQLKEVFKGLGVASGEALIAERGFIGALQAIEAAVGSTTTELGAAFGRIRAVTGALVFAGRGAEETKDKIAQIAGATREAFREDTNKIIQSTGQQLKIAGEQAKNFFEKEIGTPAVQAVVEIIKKLGGMETILNSLRVVFDLTILAVKLFTGALVIAGAALAAAIPLLILFNASLAKTALIASATALTVGTELVVLAPVIAALVPVIAAVGAAFAAWSVISDQVTKAVIRDLERQNLAVLALRDSQNDATRALTQATIQETEKRNKEEAQILLKSLAKRRQILEEEDKALARANEGVRRRFKNSQQDFNKGLNEGFNALKKKLADFTRDAEDSGKDLEKIFERSAKSLTTFDFDRTGFQQQLQLIDDEISRLETKAAGSAAVGDLQGFRKSASRIQELADQRVKVQGNLNNALLDLDIKLEAARQKFRNSTTTKETDEARSQISILTKDRNDIQQLTGQQLDLEKQITRAIEDRRNATTSQELDKATDSLRLLRSQQDLVRDSAENTRQARIKSLDTVEKLAGQLEKIKREEEERFRILNQERVERERLISLNKLVTAEAEAFKRTSFDKAKSETDVVELFEKQKTTLIQLLNIQKELGGPGQAKAELVIRERIENLRLDAENTLNKMRNSQNAKDVDAATKRVNLEAKASAEENQDSLKRIVQFRDAFANLPKQAFLLRQQGDKARGDIRLAPETFKVEIKQLADSSLKISQLVDEFIKTQEPKTANQILNEVRAAQGRISNLRPSVEASEDPKIIAAFREASDTALLIARSFRKVIPPENVTKSTVTGAISQIRDERNIPESTLSKTGQQVVKIGDTVAGSVVTGFKKAEPGLVAAGEQFGRAVVTGMVAERQDIKKKLDDLRAKQSPATPERVGLTTPELRLAEAKAQSKERTDALAKFVKDQDAKTAAALKARGITQAQVDATDVEIKKLIRLNDRVDGADRFGRSPDARKGDFLNPINRGLTPILDPVIEDVFTTELEDQYLRETLLREHGIDLLAEFFKKQAELLKRVGDTSAEREIGPQLPTAAELEFQRKAAASTRATPMVTDNIAQDILLPIYRKIFDSFEGFNLEFKNQFVNFVKNPQKFGMDPLAEAQAGLTGDRLRRPAIEFERNQISPSAIARVQEDATARRLFRQLLRAREDTIPRLFSQLLPIRNTSIPDRQEQSTSTNNRVTVNIVVNNPRNGLEVVEQLNAEFRRNPDKFLFGRGR